MLEVAGITQTRVAYDFGFQSWETEQVGTGGIPVHQVDGEGVAGLKQGGVLGDVGVFKDNSL